MSTPPVRALVVDDEPVARRRVVRLLSAAADFAVAGECPGGECAVRFIQEERPDVVFLDVQMPDMDGFSVLQAVGVEQMPLVVFVTAFDQHALRAFDAHAVDYLLKPYTEERFQEALGQLRLRVDDRGEGELASSQLRMLLTSALDRGPESAATHLHWIAVKSNNRTRIVPVGEVDYFETDGNYVRVYIAGRRYLIRHTANRLEQMLDPRKFARIHRRFLVNLDRVLEIEPWVGGDAIVHLRDGGKLRLSRNYRDAFHARMIGDAGPD